jgi:hypothetical protein
LVAFLDLHISAEANCLRLIGNVARVLSSRRAAEGPWSLCRRRFHLSIEPLLHLPDILIAGLEALLLESAITACTDCPLV